MRTRREIQMESRHSPLSLDSLFLPTGGPRPSASLVSSHGGAGAGAPGGPPLLWAGGRVGSEPSGGGAPEQSVEHGRAPAGARSRSCKHGGRRRPELSGVMEEAPLLPAGMRSAPQGRPVPAGEEPVSAGPRGNRASQPRGVSLTGRIPTEQIPLPRRPASVRLWDAREARVQKVPKDHRGRREHVRLLSRALDPGWTEGTSEGGRGTPGARTQCPALWGDPAGWELHPQARSETPPPGGPGGDRGKRGALYRPGLGVTPVWEGT